MARRHILSIVALCIVVVVLPGALSRKYRKGGKEVIDGGEDAVCLDEDAVCLFHFGPVDSREEYINPLTGEVNGYHVDLLNALCQIGEKNCEIVYDISSNCWDTVDGMGVGGFGLFNFYYDACIGWYPTLDRLRTFGFSLPYSQSLGSGFAVPIGNRAGFDPADLSGMTIGFIRGFFSNAECITRRLNVTLSDDQIMMFDTAPQLLAALGDRNSPIDAAFDVERQFDPNRFDYLTPEPDTSLECTEGGPAFMFRKDNKKGEWLDAALEQLIGSPEYDEICAGLEGIHGHKIGGTADNTCIGYPKATTTSNP